MPKTKNASFTHWLFVYINDVGSMLGSTWGQILVTRMWGHFLVTKIWGQFLVTKIWATKISEFSVAGKFD